MIRAIDLAPTAPDQAKALIAGARRGGRDSAEIASMIERALGLVALGRGDGVAAVRHLRAAVALAAAAGLDQRGAEARMSLSFALYNVGDTVGALRAADEAAPLLQGLAAARMTMQRALVLGKLGRGEDSLDGYRRALAAFQVAGDRRWEMKLRLNRGWLYGYRGEWRAAVADLQRAEHLATAIGDGVSAAAAVHNLGFVAGLRGDIPLALARYEQAERGYRAAGSYTADLLLDRAAVLLSVRLVTEARRDAEQAVAEMAVTGMAADAAEGRLVVARAALLGGDADAAQAHAEQARRAFARQRRPAWRAQARYLALQARWQREGASPALLDDARRTASLLTATGWTVQALDARLIAARVALDLGRPLSARRQLALAAPGRSGGPAELRARLWHAEGLRRLAEGDRRGAKAALRAGLGVLDRFRAALGATELRARVTAHGTELALLALRLVIEDGRPDAVLVCAERWRAAALRLPPVRPPDDAALVDDLAALRRAVADVDRAALQGRDTLPLMRRQAQLERGVRARARSTPGMWGDTGTVTPDRLRVGLGSATLVAYVAADDILYAVTVTGGGAHLQRLCHVGPVDRELASLRFALRRLARRDTNARTRAAVQHAATVAAARLDDLLVASLPQLAASGALVVVPTGTLHALPWALLPSLTGREVTTAASATLWHRAASAPPVVGGKHVLVAGPGLPHARAEVIDLSRVYPEAQCLTDTDAETVLSAMDGAWLAHVAAHGRFRADNPLFSALMLSDGPLTVYDLERLRAAPRLLVLSACDSGVSEVAAGDELMGLAATLLALGTRTLVAAVAPVNDAVTRDAMVTFHRSLRSGAKPAAALARVQAEFGEEERFAGAGSFVCFGAG